MAQNSWAHSVCSQEELVLATSNNGIKYIESDIIVSSSSGLPVMAHPPATDSSLSFETFMKVAAPSGKGLKLDFKDQAAVLPCLQLTAELDKQGIIRGDQTVWLNADILPGPGGSPKSVLFDSSLFIETCTRVYPRGVLSLGWKVDLSQSGVFYTQEHCDEMLLLVKKFGLQVKRLVFAVAARPCAVDTRHLKELLRKLPQSELLIWTGTGEPPISVSLVKYLETEFEEFTTNISSNVTSSQIPSRISYDVSVSTGVIDTSLSESKLFIHRFIHRLDDFNHFFIIKFLNMLPSSSSSSHLLNNDPRLSTLRNRLNNNHFGIDEQDDEDDDDDIEAGDREDNGVDDDSISETPSQKAKRVLKQSFFIGFLSTSGVVSICGIFIAKKMLFDKKNESSAIALIGGEGSLFSTYNPFRFLLSFFKTILSGREDGKEDSSRGGGGVGTKVALGAVGSALALSKKRRGRK